MYQCFDKGSQLCEVTSWSADMILQLGFSSWLLRGEPATAAESWVGTSLPMLSRTIWKGSTQDSDIKMQHLSVPVTWPVFCSLLLSLFSLRSQAQGCTAARLG